MNSLTVKQEIGGPMASLYLLGNPDHYTNFWYKPFYWKNYVKEAGRPWQSAKNAETSESVGQDLKFQDNMEIDENMKPTVALHQKGNGDIYANSPVYDYTLRPKQCESMSLYEWISTATKHKVYNRKQSQEGSTISQSSRSSSVASDNKPPSIIGGSQSITSEDYSSTAVEDSQDSDYDSVSTIIAQDDQDSDYEQSE